MLKLQSGEVWWVDPGLAAKIRPCLILKIIPLTMNSRWLSSFPTQPRFAETDGNWQSRSDSSSPARFTCSKSSLCLLPVWKANWVPSNY